MNILLLGPDRPNLTQYLSRLGDEVTSTEEKLIAGSPMLAGVDWLISYGYRHIIKPDLIAAFPKRIINLHISYLPWNRGADPNLWSFLEDTPKGVTIHYIDAGLDTGDILAQREVAWHSGDTLRSTYARLSTEIERLFCETWPAIRDGRCSAIRQPTGGSCHRLKDKAPYEHLLTQGWDTPVLELLGKASVRVPV